ncbi:DUF1353 domain-containing protein [Campylobacter fetus]|uniref:DUF1353 domain-containing protein n=1 Tax=Campylobacter fetus TaxID=196 RepID=UPI0026DF1810|nr:DUF1353 domain-containing protein [Campylobacter fetus]WKW24042.1 DUF1353 domain-containing protein [Campylobacter fetus subsp. venerealis]WKW24774.1 DUF1353 domain-containing protein [Campylobacter fetus subsp. venerealis]WKW25265.1 DUF1353 domain-containing protein [Campylobacter fetus subsp. venerealis]WKW25712.1 DUF1353 domain-containing protein [Campylobacter fetus subsp. venerealis]
MANFKTQLIVATDLSGYFITQKELKYIDNRLIIKIPKGFKFNGATVPKWLNLLIPKFGYKYDRSVCLHDYLYFSKQLSKKESDKMFYEAMRAEKVNRNLAFIIYLAVRVFGRKSWEK